MKRDKKGIVKKKKKLHCVKERRENKRRKEDWNEETKRKKKRANKRHIRRANLQQELCNLVLCTWLWPSHDCHQFCVYCTFYKQGDCWKHAAPGLPVLLHPQPWRKADCLSLSSNAAFKSCRQFDKWATFWAKGDASTAAHIPERTCPQPGPLWFTPNIPLAQCMNAQARTLSLSCSAVMMSWL